MSKVFIEESTLSSIGDAIRSKTGEAGLIAPLDMATAISNLATGGGGNLQYTYLEGGSTGTSVITWNLSNSLMDETTPFMLLMTAGNSSSSFNASTARYPLVFYWDGNSLEVVYCNTSNSYSSGKYYVSSSYENMKLIVNFSTNIYQYQSAHLFYNV